jgi:DNA-binding response OmpR family regulator
VFKVLIVDDDSKVADVLAQVVEEEGYTPLVARSGTEAMDLVGRDAPDVVLLDIEMPEMDGFDFLTRIKASATTARIPVVMITGRGETSDMTRSVRLGARDYIQKPWQPGEVEKSIKWALRSVGKLPPEPQHMTQ